MRVPHASWDSHGKHEQADLVVRNGPLIADPDYGTFFRLAAAGGCTRNGAHWPVASRYCATIAAGTRPRSLTSIPWLLAPSRTFVLSTSLLTALDLPTRHVTAV
jgi:hypothetical protein